MFSKEKIILEAQKAIRIEAQAIAALEQYVQEAFVQAVEWMYATTGKIVICGIGKSALIAQKIVATLNSTGTVAAFLHAADAIHGDIGLVQNDDVVIIISKSGESPEIKTILPLIKNRGNKTIALCGFDQSYLAKQADVFINTYVAQEACPNNLAPTSSTSAQMVMGDALAVVLIQLKHFSSEDFAKVHPGGNLGKKLYTKVKDLIIHNALPKVQLDSSIRAIILEISSKRLGATVVVDDTDAIKGIITDGDIRRMLEKYADVDPLKAQDILNPQAKSIDSEALAVEALKIIQEQNISQLIVTHQGQYCGMLHLHDLIREGII